MLSVFVTRRTSEGSIIGTYIDGQTVSAMRDAALEEAARLCEYSDKSSHPSDIADNIRTLKGKIVFSVPPILELK